MERFTNCTRCGTPLYGDREPLAGICGVCTRPRPLRRRRRVRSKRLTFTCEQCGVQARQTVMGRPRLYCPACSTSTARRYRARARSIQTARV